MRVSSRGKHCKLSTFARLTVICETNRNETENYRFLFCKSLAYFQFVSVRFASFRLLSFSLNSSSESVHLIFKYFLEANIQLLEGQMRRYKELIGASRRHFGSDGFRRLITSRIFPFLPHEIVKRQVFILVPI